MNEAELQALVKSIQGLRDELRGSSAELRDELRSSSAEVRAEMREARMETERVIRKMAGVVSYKWGNLVEAVVEPGVMRKGQERGFEITQSSERE